MHQRRIAETRTAAMPRLPGRGEDVLANTGGRGAAKHGGARVGPAVVAPVTALTLLLILAILTVNPNAFLLPPETSHTRLHEEGCQ